MSLTIGQQIILEREINRTYDTIVLMLSVLTVRREVIDFASLKTLTEGLRVLVEDLQADRAKAAQLSDEDRAAIQAVHLATLTVFVGSLPPIPETSTVKPVYDAAVKALRARVYEES